MKASGLLLLFAVCLSASLRPITFASAADQFPYLGNWSNGRGETLTITRKTLQFADNKPVPYRDVTRATDGARFELLITAAGQVNAFPGKVLGVQCENNSMEITTYVSHSAYMEDAKPQSKVTWWADRPANVQGKSTLREHAGDFPNQLPDDAFPR